MNPRDFQGFARSRAEFKCVVAVGQRTPAICDPFRENDPPFLKIADALLVRGLEAHHLFEKRFAAVLGVKEGDMAAIAFTKAESQMLTNAWRQTIGYGAGAANATKHQIMDAAKQIYKDYPDILRALESK